MLSDGITCISARSSQRRKEQGVSRDDPDASNSASETKCALSAKVPSVMKCARRGSHSDSGSREGCDACVRGRGKPDKLVVDAMAFITSARKARLRSVLA